MMTVYGQQTRLGQVVSWAGPDVAYFGFGPRFCEALLSNNLHVSCFPMAANIEALTIAGQAT